MEQFRATEPGIKVLFGTPNAPSEPVPFDTDSAVGRAWLFALHARSALARGRLWQTQMMLDQLRDTLIALKCARAGVNPWQGRGADRLPAADLRALEATLPEAITFEALEPARVLLSEMLLDEVAKTDPDRAIRLQSAFAELTRPAG